MKTARQQLGEVITFRLSQQRRTDRDVANRCGVSTSDVERFRAGTLVPEPKTWKRMCEMIARSLYGDSALYTAARAEQEGERELATRGLQRMNPTRNGAPPPTNVATNLGDKLREVKLEPAVPAPDARTVNPGQAVTYHAPAPEPDLRPTPTMKQLGVAPRGRARDGRVLLPTRPDGSMSADKRAERITFARSILLQRPAIPLNGEDGLLSMMRKRFGIGLDPETIQTLRRQLDDERREAEVRAKLEAERGQTPAPAAVPAPPPIQAAPAASPAPVPATPPRAVSEDNIATAVGLIVAEVPGLRRMTIEVNDAGEASYTYEVREVRTGGGRVLR